MRLRIILDCDCGTVLPFNYNHQLVKVINSAFYGTSSLVPSRCNGFKLYTFSQLYFDQYNIAESGIQNMGREVHWYVSSPMVYFLEKLLKGLKKAGHVNLDSIQMSIHDIEVLGDPDIGRRMEFSCMSPISLARQPSTQDSRLCYGRIEDHDFVEKLRQELINKFFIVYNSLPRDESMTIEFNQQYIDSRHRVSRLVEYNGIKILGYMVPFIVSGNPELIRLGYQLGFGHRNSCGFGMVKVWYPPNCSSDFVEETMNEDRSAGNSQ